LAYGEKKAYLTSKSPKGSIKKQNEEAATRMLQREKGKEGIGSERTRDAYGG